ncbi:MAG TPA: aldehyde dehydrogenase family protein, partial [Terriglobales bacterium]|nr:aldehyde dehydrogenase family protein [Terriglobales bacterium]
MAQMTATPVRTRGFYLQGKWVEDGTPVEIHAPYDGAPLAIVFQATREHAEKAIQAATEAFGSTRRLPAFERQRVLRSIA